MIPRKTGIYLFLIVAILWMGAYIITPPTFSGTDIFEFKDAGVNLATGRGLVISLGPSHPEIEPGFYSTYPPLYPVLYALFVWLLGVGPKVNRLFDLAITAMAALLFWLAVQPRISPRTHLLPDFLLLLLLLATLPVGPFWIQCERPDGLSFVLTILSLMIFNQRFRPINMFGSALLLGLNGLVSPLGFVLNFTGLFLSVIIARYSLSPDEPQPSYLVALLLGAMGVFLPLGLGFGLLWLKEPLAMQRFLGHALGSSTGGNSGVGYFLALLSGDLDQYLKALHRLTNLANFVYVKPISLFMVTAVIIGYLLLFRSLRKEWPNRILSIATLAIFLFILVVFPYQTNYMSFASAVILVLFARLAVTSSTSLAILQRWIILGYVLYFSVFGILFELREIVAAWQSGPSYYRMQRVLEQYRMDPDQKILIAVTGSPTYFLFKSQGFQVVNLAFVVPSHLPRIDLLGLSFVGTGDPFKVRVPEWWDGKGMELLYRPSLPQQTRLWGYAVSRSSNTWEVELYRRR